MAQLEGNLASRLARLEQKLAAYRKLHADELDEIGRELGELRQVVEALATTLVPSADRPALEQPQPPCVTKAPKPVRWPNLLRSSA